MEEFGRQDELKQRAILTFAALRVPGSEKNPQMAAFQSDYWITFAIFVL